MSQRHLIRHYMYGGVHLTPAVLAISFAISLEGAAPSAPWPLEERPLGAAPLARRHGGDGPSAVGFGPQAGAPPSSKDNRPGARRARAHTLLPALIRPVICNPAGTRTAHPDPTNRRRVDHEKT